MNLETALLNGRQMAAADRLAVAAGIPAVELMENAGHAVAREIQRRWSARPVSVLCGPGNNGGDGFVAARLLAQTGWPVRLALAGSRDRLTGEARHHAQLWSGAVEPLTPAVLDGAELVVDALFGAGLSRPLAGPAAEALSAADRRRSPVVAIDVPSGLLGDTGASLGAVAAVLTVTFFRKKPGHLLSPGRLLCGEIVLADIGIPAAVLDHIIPDTFENDPRLWLSALPPPTERADKITSFPDDPPALVWMIVGTSLRTPDPDEFRRWDEPDSDPLTRARAAASRSGAILILSGGETIIAAPNGRAIIHPHAPPNPAPAELRTDLGGTLQGLLDQGMEPFLAAAAAVWRHLSPVPAAKRSAPSKA